MLIKISALIQEPIGESREYGFIGEIVDDATVNCEAELLRTEVGIRATATCASEQERTCSLCLKPYTHKMQFSFDEEFYPVIDIATGRKLPERDTIEDLLISETHHLDIADAVRQHLIMHEPRILSANRIAPASAHSAERTAIRYPASVRQVPLKVSGLRLCNIFGTQTRINSAPGQRNGKDSRNHATTTKAATVKRPPEQADGAHRPHTGANIGVPNVRKRAARPSRMPLMWHVQRSAGHHTAPRRRRITPAKAFRAACHRARGRPLTVTERVQA